MVEKKMEEKVDYTELNFDVDDTEIPLREVSKEEVTAKTTRKKQEKIEVSGDDLQGCLSMFLQIKRKHFSKK